MLRELLDAWRSKDILGRMFDEFGQMIIDAEWMFKTACNVMMHATPREEAKDELYRRDKQINGTQRTIRRQIVEHLSIRPSVDANSCLILMSVVKDAERIGDYCKNIFEVATMYTGNFDHGRYITPLQGIIHSVQGMFSKTLDGFEENDEKLAKNVISSNEVLAKQCDMLIGQLIRDKIPTEKAVAYTLLARHFKRVAGHLANIATSVLYPIEYIDFPADHVPKSEG